MLTLRNTPSMDKIEILGNPQDLEALYSSLRAIVGDEGEYGVIEGHRVLVLSLCTDLREAIQGDRGAELKDSGSDLNKIWSTANDVPVKDLDTCPCTINYPEALFVTMFLNDFIRDYARRKAVGSRFPLLDEINLWDADIAYVRLFQSLVVNCLEEVVTEDSFTRILNLMSKGLSKD